MTAPLLDLDLPAVPESATVARHAVTDALRGVAVDRDAVIAMVSEAVANSATHAYPDGARAACACAPRSRVTPWPSP